MVYLIVFVLAMYSLTEATGHKVVSSSKTSGLGVCLSYCDSWVLYSGRTPPCQSLGPCIGYLVSLVLMILLLLLELVTLQSSKLEAAGKERGFVPDW